MEEYHWDRDGLKDPLKLGRYAEYLAKMEFTYFGFDVYATEVDNQGIDLVVRKPSEKYYEVQVKSCRHFNYIFFTKKKFSPRDNLLAVVVLFLEGKPPQLYLIPSTKWLTLDSLFVSRDYDGKKSKPEWGLNFSRRNLPKLAEFAFDQQIAKL